MSPDQGAGYAESAKNKKSICGDHVDAEAAAAKLLALAPAAPNYLLEFRGCAVCRLVQKFPEIIAHPEIARAMKSRGSA